jgi:hypothetical protein
MKPILTTLSDLAVDPFAWNAPGPGGVLVSSGLSTAEATSVLAALAEPSERPWHSCDTCWDPGPDDDPFEEQ